MDLAPSYLSLGGVAVGTTILALVLQRWWMKEQHDPIALVPFVLSGLHGMLVVLTAGGLLGAAAWLALWGANGLGDLALVYGVGSSSPGVTRGQSMALTPGGSFIVIVLTALLFGAWRWSKRLPRKKVGLGMLCGLCFGLNGSVAGVMAVPLATAANVAGAWWAGA